MLTRKRVLAGVVIATAAGILFTGGPAAAQPVSARATSASVVQGAPARTAAVMNDHHRRHFRHYRHHRPWYWRHHRHHRPWYRRHRRHHRPWYRHHRRHFRHGRYMGFSRSLVNRNANVNLNRVSTGAIVANQNNNVAIARGGFRRAGW